MGLSARSFSGRFWALIAATFLGFLGIGAVLPQIGPHVRHDLGGSDRTVGFVIGVFSFVALGGRLFSGPLADRRGRKVSFLAGLFSCALAGVAYWLPLGIGGAYLGRVFQGIGEACLYTGAAAWAVELAGLERSAQALGYISSGIWGGISAGPMVGSWLGSFQNAAIFQVCAALAGFAILTRVPEDYKPAARSGKRRWLGRHVLAAGLTTGFVNVHYPVITGFLILHLANRGNSGRASFTAYAGTVLLSRFFLGGLPDRIRPAITFYGGITCAAIGLAIIAAGPSPPVAVAASAILGFGFSFPWASIASTVLKRTPAGERGSTVSILSAFYDLFVGVSSFAAGAVANRFGYGAAFAMATVALGAAGIAGRFVFTAQRAADEAPEEAFAEAGR